VPVSSPAGGNGLLLLDVMPEKSGQKDEDSSDNEFSMHSTSNDISAERIVLVDQVFELLGQFKGTDELS